MRLLFVDSEGDVAALVGRPLLKDGHRVVFARTLSEANAHLAAPNVDLIVVDVELLDGSGIDWCLRVRGEGIRTSVLMIGALSEVSRRVAALDAGADDFLGKPFAMEELRARIRAIGRRTLLEPRNDTTRGLVRLDFTARRATVHGEPVAMTAGEWCIVEVLETRSGRFVPVDDLADIVGIEPRSLRVLIGRIRKKLGNDYIQTCRGGGYAIGIASQT